MSNYAYIDSNTNIVINVFVGPPSDNPPDGYQYIEIQEGVIVGPGWTWNGTDFINPETQIQ